MCLILSQRVSVASFFAVAERRQVQSSLHTFNSVTGGSKPERSWFDIDDSALMARLHLEIRREPGRNRPPKFEVYRKFEEQDWIQVSCPPKQRFARGQPV